MKVLFSFSAEWWPNPGPMCIHLTTSAWGGYSDRRV